MTDQLQALFAAQNTPGRSLTAGPIDIFNPADVASTQASFATSATSAPKSTIIFDPISQISLPLNYNNLLETFLAASNAGEVFPYYVRQVLLVKAGTIGELVTTIPTGDTAAVVYLQKLHVDTYSSEFLCTFQADSLPPLFVDEPMNFDIEVLGSFLPPAHTQGVYTLQNNDSMDITFTADVQIAVMTSDFARTVYEPLVKGQYEVLRQLAGKFATYRGGGSY